MLGHRQPVRKTAAQRRSGTSPGAACEHRPRHKHRRRMRLLNKTIWPAAGQSSANYTSAIAPAIQWPHRRASGAKRFRPTPGTRTLPLCRRASAPRRQRRCPAKSLTPPTTPRGIKRPRTYLVSQIEAFSQRCAPRRLPNVAARPFPSVARRPPAPRRPRAAARDAKQGAPPDAAQKRARPAINRNARTERRRDWTPNAFGTPNSTPPMLMMFFCAELHVSRQRHVLTL